MSTDVSKSMEAKEALLPVWNGPFSPKPRLPRAFAWVVGVERLSARFADVPQYPALQVWFEDHPIDCDCTVTIMTATSSHISHQVFTVWYSTRGEPRWYFMVYPVESQKRAHVRQLLEEQAFPVVEKWLIMERSGVWLQTSRHLRCIWDKAADRIVIKEESC
jgi:hypothetical protein